MTTSIWAVATDIVAALGAGLELFMRPPLSYVIVAGFVIYGLKFVRGLIRK